MVYQINFNNGSNSSINGSNRAVNGSNNSIAFNYKSIIFINSQVVNIDISYDEISYLNILAVQVDETTI